jgi:beta-fructofuranosidase
MSPNCPIVADVFHTGVLNGLLRDVRVFDGPLSPADLGRVMQESKPSSSPDLQINGPWCADDPQRPQYHAIPPRAWTNEPHGLIHWGGQYHLFYQKNPDGPYWGHINWGHMTSPDLYRWTEVPVALSPEPGPDNDGCWSGSVIDYNRKLAIIYTGGDGHRASICLALSDDGIHFIKHPGNPVIPQPPEGQGFPEFRDPFVWRQGDTYYLIIGSAITGKGGTALLYRSTDLINWEYRKPLLVGDRETSGVFWEMPVFVKLGEQHALIVCEVPGRASYWVGTWKDETFTPHSMCPQRLELFNHLLSPTPHILEDGRVVTMGIIPDERSPKECWRAGWAHHYSLPRLISVDAQGRIHQSAFEGIESWGESVASISNLDLTDGSMKQVEQASGTALNIRVVFKKGDSHSVTLRFRCSTDGREYTELRYHWEIGRLILDRTHSSLDVDVKRDLQDSTYFPDTKDSLEMNLFLDGSVLEAFVDQRSAFATRIYPTLPASTGVWVGSEGAGAKIESLTVKRIKRPQ